MKRVSNAGRGGTAEQAAVVFNAPQQHSAAHYRTATAVGRSFPPLPPAADARPKAEQPTKNVMKRNGRKACNCSRSACLKLYCDCFANGEFCDGCNCRDCHNDLDHDFERSKAIKQCLDRNPNAFQPKIASTSRGRSQGGDRVHLKGCHCKRSNCLKNYCECYEARVACSVRCKCVGCCNVDSGSQHNNNSMQGRTDLIGGPNLASVAGGQFQNSLARSHLHQPHRQTNAGLMSLAAAAAADMDLCSPAGSGASGQPSHLAHAGLGNLPPKATPWYYMTDEVVEATALCLMAQAEECERRSLEQQSSLDLVHMEAGMLREFGRCLTQVVANCAQHSNPDDL